MPNGNNRILGPSGRPADQTPRILAPRNANMPAPPPDKGTVTMIQKGTGAVLGKKFTEIGLVRLICRLIEDKGGLISVAAKDIEDLDSRTLNFKYSRDLDIFDIAVSKANEPNTFDEVVSEPEQEGSEDSD